MKRKAKTVNDDLRQEYDFASMTGGVRGKYRDRLASSSNIIVLDDDVADAFGTDKDVNDALRALLALAATVGRTEKLPNKPLPPTGSASG
jgi:hypothetical protein